MAGMQATIFDVDPVKCLLGHVPRGSGLGDDQVVPVGLDDLLDPRIFVPWEDEKLTRPFAHVLVDVRPDHDVLRTVCVGALAQEDGLGHRCAVTLLQARDVLVHLAKEGLVAGGPLLPE